MSRLSIKLFSEPAERSSFALRIFDEDQPVILPLIKSHQSKSHRAKQHRAKLYQESATTQTLPMPSEKSQRNADIRQVVQYKPAQQQTDQQQPAQRAYLLRTNDCCPQCQRSLVEPLELQDAIIGRNQRPVPGTSTLIGFHCQSCEWEWPIPSRRK